MLSIVLLFKGMVLGLAVAAPVGPIGSLCINRTVERGFWPGVACGFGAALADAVFAAVAAAGFAAASHILDEFSVPLQIVGGALILAIGLRTVKAPAAGRVASVDALDILHTTIGTFFITITNPATILGFAALFAAVGLADASDWWEPTALVLGVFLGSLAWWFILCGMVNWLHRKLPDRFAVWAARTSAAVLIAFGLLSMGFGLRTLAFG